MSFSTWRAVTLCMCVCVVPSALHILCIYSWALKYTGVNCEGSLNHGYFSTVNTTVCGWLNPWMQRNSGNRESTVSWPVHCLRVNCSVYIALNCLLNDLLVILAITSLQKPLLPLILTITAALKPVFSTPRHLYLATQPDHPGHTRKQAIFSPQKWLRIKDHLRSLQAHFCFLGFHFPLGMTKCQRFCLSVWEDRSHWNFLSFSWCAAFLLVCRQLWSSVLPLACSATTPLFFAGPLIIVISQATGMFTLP